MAKKSLNLFYCKTIKRVWTLKTKNETKQWFMKRLFFILLYSKKKCKLKIMFIFIKHYFQPLFMFKFQNGNVILNELLINLLYSAFLAKSDSQKNKLSLPGGTASASSSMEPCITVTFRLQRLPLQQQNLVLLRARDGLWTAIHCDRSQSCFPLASQHPETKTKLVLCLFLVLLIMKKNVKYFVS